MFPLLGDGLPARGFDVWNLLFNTGPFIVLLAMIAAIVITLIKLWPGEDGEDGEA